MAFDDLLTISEVATMLGVTVQRTHQLIGRYDVPVVVVNARMKLVRKNDADKLLDMDRPSGVHVEKRIPETKKSTVKRVRVTRKKKD